MFHHQGTNRTLRHNLGLASLLSFVAGIVNVAGFMAVQRLTTNVTGHFAYFIDEVVQRNLWNGFIFFLYIFFFFLGSFISGLLVEFMAKRSVRHVFVVPTIIESLILLGLAFLGKFLLVDGPNALAFCLLFAMGLQNSLVTSISKATVRTTHLTGLFTDLGIELSQLFFYREKTQREKLRASIKLRFSIIAFFFLGGLLGGLLYSTIGLRVLAIAGFSLLIGIAYDSFKQSGVTTVSSEDLPQ